MGEGDVMAVFIDDVLNIQMDVPVGWEAERVEQFALIFFAPAHDGYRVNLGFNIGRLDPPVLDSLKTLIDDTQAEQQRTYNEYALTRGEAWLLDGYPAYTRHYTWHDTGTDLRFAQIQAFVYYEPHLYVIDGSSLQQHADTYLPMFDAIIRSLHFLPPAEMGNT